MASSKSSKLSNRPALQRADERTQVSIEGRCRAGEREIQDVLVLDLAANGCRLLGLSVGVTKSDPLELWLGGQAGPFAARLKWAKRGSLGVAFDSPLDEALLQRLALEAPAPNVIAMRRTRPDQPSG